MKAKHTKNSKKYSRRTKVSVLSDLVRDRSDYSSKTKRPSFKNLLWEWGVNLFWFGVIAIVFLYGKEIFTMFLREI
jgi:hypothetical protein